MSTNPYAVATAHLAQVDVDWAALIAAVGPCELRLKPEREPYDALVRAVAYQQLHAKAAEAILGRMLALHDDTMPAPQALLATEFDALRACGFSARKIATLRAIAEAALSGQVPDLDTARQLDDEALIARLVDLPGIGRWTVEMLLIFTLGRTDVLPVDDFGVREGYRRLKRLEKAPTPKALAQLGTAWQPWRSIAAWYLWRVPRS